MALSCKVIWQHTELHAMCDLIAQKLILIVRIKSLEILPRGCVSAR
jgi:hypothetical protein